MRLTLSQFCLPGLSTAEFLDVAERAGWEGCELGAIGGPRGSEDPKTMAAAARASGLPVESLNVLRDWALPDDPDCRPVFDMLVELAVETSAPFIICVAPIRYENMPPGDEVLAAASERLAMFAELAEPDRRPSRARTGRALVHPHRGEERNPDARRRARGRRGRRPERRAGDRQLQRRHRRQLVRRDRADPKGADRARTCCRRRRHRFASRAAGGGRAAALLLRRRAGRNRLRRGALGRALPGAVPARTRLHSPGEP